MQPKNDGPSDVVSISRTRAKFSRDLNDWRKIQLQQYPKLRDHIQLVDSATPEEAQLLLPSAFTAELRHSLGLTELAAIEYELREGQAHDALQALRQVIQEFNYNLLDKKNNVHGIAATLRSESFLRVFTSDKKIAAETYRRSRKAMLSLGLSETDSHWRELRDDELWGKNVSTVRSMGDSKRRDPWFWQVVAPRGLSQEKEKEWSLDSTWFFPFVLTVWIICCFAVDRVKWFRDRADRDRFREEVQILEAEFERTIVSHARMADVWAQLAGTASGPGATAYAHKKAYMYRCLSTECSEAYDIAKKKKPVVF